MGEYGFLQTGWPVYRKASYLNVRQTLYHHRLGCTAMTTPQSPLPAFPCAVVAAIRRIPKGKVATYGEIARAAGNPRAARAVVAVLKTSGRGLPWQRVVSSGGRIGLPGAAGAEQRFLLEQEGVRFRGARVDPVYLFHFG
jgi:alkylated DNA nucleotide flippase Atl1